LVDVFSARDNRHQHYKSEGSIAQALVVFLAIKFMTYPGIIPGISRIKHMFFLEPPASPKPAFFWQWRRPALIAFHS
jgi:hypothetical protein